MRRRARRTGSLLFSEAAIISDDPRLPRAAADLLAGVLRSHGAQADHPAEPNPATVDVVDALRLKRASLLSVNVPEARDPGGRGDRRARARRRRRLPSGRGCVASDRRRRHSSAAVLTDHVRSASTLLTAYMLTARLPYAMLADELMQSVVRTRPRRCARRRAVCARPATPRGVFCRLAALHRDDEYRRTAVLAVGADYGRNATRTLEALAPSVREAGRRRGAFRSRTRRMARSAIKSADSIADSRLAELAIQSAI